MRQCLEQLVAAKKVVAINFPAAAGDKMITATGTIQQVGDDFMIMLDIYGNTMIVPYASIAYIEIKK